jgi:hypothetical protein
MLAVAEEGINKLIIIQTNSIDTITL